MDFHYTKRWIITITHMTTCSVCCENFTKCTRAKITCCQDDCKYDACKSCVRQYLLSTTSDPHCMNCKKAWSQKFILENTNKAFYDNDYRKHRKKLLLETELSKMPETMPAVERISKIKEEETHITKLNAQISEFRKAIAEIEKEKSVHSRAMLRLKSGKEVKDERRAFVMPCPSNDCRGYLSTQYKCDLCKLYTCPDCNEIIGHNKTDEHTCNEDSKKSAELIKKDTKPCPTCGTRIFKISGCDQMWCTECQVGFSWTTGKIATGVIHNPHFYQHQRAQNGGGAAPRNPGDVLCGGLCTFNTLRVNILNRYPDFKGRQEFTDCHRFVAHITYHELVNCREKVRTLSNHEDLRVQYLMKEKTKEELSSAVFRQDNTRRKYMEMLHIYELLSVVAIEGFRTLCDSGSVNPAFLREANKFMRDYKALCKYCNEQLAEISAVFSNVMLQVDTDANFAMRREKFTIADVQKMKEKNGKAGCSTDPM